MNLKGTRTITHGNLTWIDVHDPSIETLTELKEKFKFHELDVEDCLSENQRSKIDEYSKYLFMILHFPYYDKKSQKVSFEEVDFFLANDLLITVHTNGFKNFVGFFEKTMESKEVRENIMSKGSGFLLYEVIDFMFTTAFPILDNFETSIAILERDVFTLGEQRDMLRDILRTKKNIITFRRVIGPERTVVAQLEHKHKKFLADNLDLYFDDLVDKIEKIWNTLENLKELVESLQDTNESIISHATNNVIRMLTTFSVIMLPLTFITGLYGMNVNLPLAEQNEIFFVLTGVMLFIVLSMLAFFKYKKWI